MTSEEVAESAVSWRKLTSLRVDCNLTVTSGFWFISFSFRLSPTVWTLQFVGRPHVTVRTDLCWVHKDAPVHTPVTHNTTSSSSIDNRSAGEDWAANHTFLRLRCRSADMEAAAAAWERWAGPSWPQLTEQRAFNQPRRARTHHVTEPCWGRPAGF